jgi:hypothetical protein
MSLFNRTFKQHIQDELTYRTDFNAVQTTLMPHIRVTSLVEGYLEPWGRIDGFTLGITDVNNINSLSSYFNAAGGKGTAIGLTYPNRGKAIPVRLPGGPRNLPPPGVTNVSISTQSKGGFLFKAVVNVKFYGKEQYDFIYQTFLRPGNPIVIEYGHTRTPTTKVPAGAYGDSKIERKAIGAGSNNRDLNFFNALGDRLTQYRDNFKKNIALPTTRNSGAVVGMVSNFRVRLNEQNEYEAEIELINSLEFLYSMSPDNTFLEYRSDGQDRSRSIRMGFGMEQDNEWKAEHDDFFRMVMDDGLYEYEDITTEDDLDRQFVELYVAVRHAIRGITEPRPYAESILLPNSWVIDTPLTGREVAADSSKVLPVDVIDQTFQTARQRIMDQGDVVYVSLFYFFNTLLGKIIEKSYVDSELCVDNVGMYDIIWDDGTLDERIKYYKGLRSTNMSNVIINNQSLYDDDFMETERVDRGGDKYDRLGNEMEMSRVQYSSPYFTKKRQYAYSWKYHDSENPDYYTILPEWDTKEKYSSESPLGGIFINYTIIRQSFTNAASVAEAIQMILTAVSNTTAGILNLKMRFVSSTEKDSGAEQIRIAIYDESEVIGSDDFRPKLYNFFKGNVSEAVSYDFDFSLPNSVAAGVMASTFSPLEHKAAGGTSKEKAFIDYGYKVLPGSNPPELAIKSMLQLGVGEGEQDGGMTHPKLDPTIGDADAAAANAEFKHMMRSNEERTKSINRLAGGSAQIDDRFRGVERRRKVGLTLPSVVTLPNGKTMNVDPDKHWTPDRIKKYIEEDLHETAANQYIAAEMQFEAQARATSGATEGAHIQRAGADYNEGEASETDHRIVWDDLGEEMLLKQIIGYQELAPPAMKAAAIVDGLYSIIPSSATIAIKLQGLDGFRFGDLFTVNNILPSPYDESNIFMLTGYKHTIDSMGWYTEINATLIASQPEHLRISTKVFIGGSWWDSQEQYDNHIRGG